MPLSAALHWIASKGLVNAPDAGTDAGNQYQAAAKEFSTKVISGKVRVIGADHNQRPETLSPLEFATVRWSFFFNGDADYFSEATADDSRIVILPCEDDERSKDEFWAAGNQPRSAMLQVFKEDIRREWPFKGLQPNAAPQKSRAGAKAKWDWNDIELFVCKTLDSKGDFADVDTTADWKSQNDLIASAREYIERRDGSGNGPSETTIKDRIAPMVVRWRASRNSAGN